MRVARCTDVACNDATAVSLAAASGTNPAITINARKQADVCILEVTGPMRSSEGDPALRDEVHSRLLAGERKLVLDLRQVPVIDSMTITEVIVCHKRTRNAGADMKIVLNRKGRDVFEITRLHLVLDIYEDVDGAVNSYASPSRS